MRGLLLSLLLGGFVLCGNADAATAPPAADPVRKALEEATKLYAAGRYDEAAKIYQNAITATQSQVGPMASLNRAILYDNLGTVLFAAKKYPDADKAYQTSIDLQGKLLKAHCDVVANTLQHYSALLRKTGRAEDADAYETQAEYLKVGELSGRNPITDLNAAVESQPAEQTASAVVPPEPAQPISRVLNVIRMTDADKNLLDNPLTMQKPVYRSETYYEGGVVGDNGVVLRKTRDVLDHYETVPVTDAHQNVSYISAVAGLQKTYRLSDSTVKAMCDAINSGGTAIELGNNWLMLTDEDLDQSIWHGGCDVEMTKTPEGRYTLTTKDDRGHCTAKRMAIK